MRRVGIVGIGTTSFGNLSSYELADILAWSGCEALEDAGTDKVDQEENVHRQILKKYRNPGECVPDAAVLNRICFVDDELTANRIYRTI